jgi:xanthine dehydrogenase accessory factor
MNPVDLAHQLTTSGQPFAMATVVRCEPPASARPGAKAVILPDGSMQGWVGGSCAQPMVIREAQQALRDGKPRLVRLSPNAGEEGRQSSGVAEYLMTCHSGGTLEIFIEPVIPKPHLCLVGETPIVETLASLGSLLGFEVETVEATVEAPERFGAGTRTFVVVATMGTSDEAALEAALLSPAPYVALVSSPRRAEVMRDYLASRGVSPEQVEKLRAPAGLNIGAQTPEEIALSIMAEIVQTGATLPAGAGVAVVAPPREARDPVCGMSVEIEGARYVFEHAGTTYYFCCAQCRSRFEAEPALFTTVSG